MSKMFMNVKEVMEVLEVSESYAYTVSYTHLTLPTNSRV